MAEYNPAENTPEIEAILEHLTQLCCESLRAGSSVDTERCRMLVQSLSTNGWDRHNRQSIPLSVILHQRVVHACPEPAMHRGAEVESLAGEIARAYADFERYRTSAPEREPPAS